MRIEAAVATVVLFSYEPILRQKHVLSQENLFFAKMARAIMNEVHISSHRPKMVTAVHLPMCKKSLGLCLNAAAG